MPNYTDPLSGVVSLRQIPESATEPFPVNYGMDPMMPGANVTLRDITNEPVRNRMTFSEILLHAMRMLGIDPKSKEGKKFMNSYMTGFRG